jgi:hypothetical protein
MKNSKVSRGKGFRGAAEYDLSHDGGRVVGGNLSGKTAREIAAECGASRKLRPDIEKPVWHQSLRLVKGEKLDDETWSRLADRHMQNLGFTDLHQRVYFVHDHPEGQHVHILASRIALDGTVFLGQNENLKSTASVALLEIEFGLQVTKTAEFNPTTGLPSNRTGKKKMNRAEIEKAVRTGFKPPRLAIQEALDRVLAHATNLDQLAKDLSVRGVLMHLKTDDARKIVGIVFEYGDLMFGGSKIGERYKASQILKKLRENREHVGNKNGESTSITDRSRSAGAHREAGSESNADHQRTEPAQPAVPGSGGSGGNSDEEGTKLKTRLRT